MIVARAEKSDGSQVLLLGLTRDNLDRLLRNQPIRMTRATHGEGVPEGWTIGIISGESEQQIADALREAGLVGPDTKVVIDLRLR